MISDRATATRLIAITATLVLPTACSEDSSERSHTTTLFSEVASASGIHFIHHSGAAGAFLMPEIMGGGAGFIDVDRDGYLDIYLVDSDGPNRLYHNTGDATFVDVTDAAGVGHTGYGMGCAAGDYDNDGDEDLYVTNLGSNVLYRNNGNGTFTDVTHTAGVGGRSWSTSAAFLDYDADGDLDLFVTNYVDWSDTAAFTGKQCFAPSGTRDYCSPQAYGAPTVDTLYRNNGDGTFQDVTSEAGIQAKAGTGLGVVCADLDGDGRIDIYVANDQMPSFAWINTGDGRFVESAVRMSCAVDELGRSQAGMGVDAADIDSDGDLDLWKVHLHRESHVLYLNEGTYFDDVTSRWDLAAPTRRRTGFGTALFDYDLDGLLDTFVANGRVQIVGDMNTAKDVYAEPNQLLRQVAPGKFEDVSAIAGLALVENSRAAAFGDYDNDGDIDILVVNRDGPARLLRNDSPRQGHFCTLSILDRHGRHAIGAKVRCTIGGSTRMLHVRSAYSYCATNDPRLHLGLGEFERVDRVEIEWPDQPGGPPESFGPFQADRFVVIQQGNTLLGGDGSATIEHTGPHKPEFLRIADALFGSRNDYFGRLQIEDTRAALRKPGLTPAQSVRLRATLSTELLRVGDVDAAIEQIEAAMTMAERDPALENLLVGLYRIRGISYLRKAEVENCIIRHNAECCLFPLRGGGVHAVKSPAETAAESYAGFLQRRPGDLKIRWLYNLAHMAMGDYPEAVPEQFRIPPEAFASEFAVARLTDAAPELGVDVFNLCGGAIVEDFDNDGFLDIVTSTWDPEGPLTFYRNHGDGSFEDASNPSRLDDQLGGLNCLGGDYDNDGDVDILVLRGAWLFDQGQIRNSLLRNNSDGTFTDVTHAAGLAEPPRPTQAATWGDFDNDGDLDLYIGNESRRELRDPPGGDYPSQLFRNNGDGTFTDIATPAGVLNDRYCKGVTAGDYDNDGDLDLYVSNVGANRLYRNNGDGTFTDVAPEAGVLEPRARSFATWFFDYDNDGWLDLFVTAYDARVQDVAADSLGLGWQASPPCLYRNNGDGTFTNVTAAANLEHPWLPMGANFGDLDSDGWLDLYLATGDPDYQTLMPNVMLRNDDGRRFQNVSTAGGLGHLQKGHGVCFADIDNDGDQDIYHQLGGFYEGDGFNNALFVNPGHGNRFLYVRLVGTSSTRTAVGARIMVEIDTPRGVREIHRAVGSVSSFGGSPLRQEIGLGDATGIERLEVWWPKSGLRQSFHDIPMDAMIRIIEGDGRFEMVELKRLSLKR